MQVERYFHIRCGDRGGATARVVGDTDTIGTIGVQVAFCSRKDAFCRKTGRETALKAPTQLVPLRYLPNALSMVAAKVEKMNKRAFVHPSDFSFALKYYLPKE